MKTDQLKLVYQPVPTGSKTFRIKVIDPQHQFIFWGDMSLFEESDTKQNIIFFVNKSGDRTMTLFPAKKRAANTSTLSVLMLAGRKTQVNV